MKKCIGLILGAGFLLCLQSTSAQAQFMTTRDLATSCLSEDKAQTAVCIGYIEGVVDYHTLIQSMGTAPTIDFCLPRNITREQIAVVVLAYLRTRPQHDDFIASPVIPLALNKVFPCKETTARKRK